MKKLLTIALTIAAVLFAVATIYSSEFWVGFLAAVLIGSTSGLILDQVLPGINDGYYD